MKRKSSIGASSQPQSDGPLRGPRERPAMMWRVVFFLALFATLQLLYGSAKGTWVERLVIDQATVQTAAWLINTLDPAIGVQASGSRLRAPGGGINVLNGCEGTDMAFLMIAAMLVAPQSWRARVAGLLVGTGLVFVLNQARVVTLFYAFRTDKVLFDTLHGIVAPLLLIIGAAAFFMIWLHRHAANPAITPTAQPA
jgi:exosortase family protein XrtM